MPNLQIPKRTAAISLLTLSTAAAAQSSVTLYGFTDVAVEFLNHVQAANGQSSNLVRMTSGDGAASRWGLTGREDLGGGNTAIFKLENGFVVNSGNVGQNGRLFGRQAYVGIANAQYGTLTLGRQQNLLFDVLIPYDPMYFAPMDSAFTHDPMLAGRVDNSIKYVKSMFGFTVSGLYSFGADSTIPNGAQVPGNSRVGRDFGAGVTYQLDSFTASLVFEQQNGTSAATAANKQERYGAAIAYAFDRLTLSATYLAYRSNLGAQPARSNLYWAGATWKVAPDWFLKAAAYKTDDFHSGQDPLSVVLYSEYLLSKQTSLYALLGK